MKAVFFLIWEMSKFILTLVYTVCQYAVLLWFAFFVIVLGTFGLGVMFFLTIVFLKIIFQF